MEEEGVEGVTEDATTSAAVIEAASNTRTAAIRSPSSGNMDNDNASTRLVPPRVYDVNGSDDEMMQSKNEAFHS